MKFSILNKIVLMSVCMVLLTASSIFFTVDYYMSQGFAIESSNNIKTLKKVVDNHIATLSNGYLEESKMAANEDELVEAVQSKNYSKLKSVIDSFLRETGADLITVTDADGKVLARGHSDRRGDNVNSQATVRSALSNQSQVGIVRGTEVPFSLRASSPVKYDGRVIGTVSLGVSLNKESFVDDIKEFTGLEVTVFNKETRAMTTIFKSGQRVVGSRISNPEVIATVLDRGATFLARNNILGKEFQTAYWPIKGISGQNLGMWFIGMPVEALMKAESNVVNSSLLVILVIVPLMILAAWLIGKSLAKPIVLTTEFASFVAEGNLDHELTVTTRDEVGVLAGALIKMVANLKDMIAHAQEQTRLAAGETEKAHQAMAEAEEARAQAETAKREGMLQAARELEGVVAIISTASEELSAQIEQSSTGSDIQAQRTSETATAMEQMTASVLEVAESTGHASGTAHDAKATASSGANIVDTMIGGISEVQKHSENLQNEMVQLGHSSEKIGEIIDVISDIADQTNLLALNAAIEAARAGEAGRGFAVVADEVRKLAEKTMTATKEVEDAISGIQNGTRNSMAQCEDTVKEVVSVSEMAKNAGESLIGIQKLTDEVSDQIRGIATACEEQSSTSEEINRAIDEINNISTETSDAMRQSSEAVMNLASQAQRLQSIIEEINSDNS
ncbi:methyl-accepting chemotaxis protein [Maridesulfovibrio ferrireducens]|uniref:Methyl-accepting chemotaxis protein n=1 Tax=Maridesulfovibrio ferrireducens TaxID=246191 RepID=A0A1G9FWH4_9BACT|nr:methyl-accepting chemotaxis protein [Maridesulfovibrio ferrireducens]SDK92740.1 methyl-accepting chemotaxis protein [Maridesulfovibrio ferrireducens]